MAFLAGIVLLVLASSDITLGQRKHRANLQPVGADVKTGLHFDCPEEFGYYPHPADCTQYYVCVFGGALLESCTGGLMYSHELQTCDWPRNVGCDGTGEVIATTPTVTYSSSSNRTPETKIRYTHPPPPPPAQPAPVITSRGQPRQLHHSQQDLIKQKQQQQLYEEADDVLPPAEEIENDRQQRVYRGQPSTVGQVQRDRDGLRHHTNAIPSSSGRGEKIGVISFGTAQQYRYLTDADDILTNSYSLTSNFLKRYKRQIRQSQDHRVAIDPRHLITQPTYLNSAHTITSPNYPSIERSYVNTYRSNYLSHQYDSGQDFKPVMFPFLQTNNKSPPHPQNLKHDNFQYFNLGLSRTPLLHKFKQQTINTTRYNHLPGNRFIPSIPFTYHLLPPIIRPLNFHNLSNTNKQPNLIYKQQIAIHPNQQITQNNQDLKSHKAYNYLPSTYNDFKEAAQIYEAILRSRNLKDYLLYYTKHNHQVSPGTLNSNGTKNLSVVLNNIISDKSKSNKTAYNFENLNKTKENIPHTDDVYYYYYYDDNLDNITYKNMTTNKKKLNSELSNNYYDDYYDYKELNSSDYYYDDSYTSTKNNFNNKTKIPSLSSTSKYLKVYSTTTNLPFITLKTTNQLMSTTRPTTEKPRQRLTTHRKTHKNLSSSHLALSATRIENKSNRPTEQTQPTVSPKIVYNSSHYESPRFDPYYSVYDDDVDLYKDVEYTQHFNNESPASQTYRGTPAPSHQILTQEKSSKRGSVAYNQNSYSTPQDIYQSSVIQNYDENNYNNQDDDRNVYQTSKQTSRGDRNELNYIEESATTKRTTTRTITTTKTTPRHIPTQKSTRAMARSPNSASENEVQSTHYTLSEGSGYYHTIHVPNKTKTSPIIHESPVYLLENISDISLQAPVVNQPAPFTYIKHLTTPKTSAFHYITKSSKSTSVVSTVPTFTFNNVKSKNQRYESSSDDLSRLIIKPTTYAPPVFFLKSLFDSKLPNNSDLLSRSVVKAYSNNQPTNPLLIRSYKARVSPLTINAELLSSSNKTIALNDYIQIKDQAEKISKPFYDNSLPSSRKNKLLDENETVESFNENDFVDFESNYDQVSKAGLSSTRSISTDTDSISTTTTKPVNLSTRRNSISIPREMYNAGIFDFDANLTNMSWLTLLERLSNMTDNDSIPNINLSDYSLKESVIPKSLMNILRYELKLTELDKKASPVEGTTKSEPINTSRNTTLPTRVSRVNTAIKSVIALGGPQRQYTKCSGSNCKKISPRTNSRGRGSAHYSSSGPNDAVVVNRGTPPARSRPTLKPSTSIVSKAAEFIDIYKNPPHRPQPIYPQPQPDKTAAKCRKDVCLLPDCSCGGKEIPGDLPVVQVPQIVLLTFDDSVNDLNKGLYYDLFEKGRVNPNGCPIAATFYVSHEWTDYSQVQNLYSDGHEIASHTVSHSFGEQFSQKKWTKEVAGQREILSAYGGVRLEDVRGMRAPFLSVGGNKMFKMLYDSNFTYDSSMPIYENKPPSWPYTLDYKLFHDCMIPPCPTRSYPGVWEVPMVMWQDLNGGRCSMGDACSNPAEADGVYKMLMKNFERHYTSNRAPFGLFYHAAWFTQPHHKEAFIQFLDAINSMKDVWLVTNWQAIQWVRDPTPVSRLSSFQPFGCNYPERPKRCNNPKVCNLWHKTGVRYMRTCQPCPDIYPWTGNTGIRSSRIDNELED